MRVVRRLLPANPFKKKDSAPESSSEEDEEVRRHEEEQRRQREEEEKELRKLEVLDRVLPWNLEQQVALYLNPIKIPLVFMVTILGCYVEHQIQTGRLESWKAPLMRPGATCWVHKMDKGDLITHDIKIVSSFLNRTFYPYAVKINKELLKHRECRENVLGQTECNFFHTPSWLDFKVDYCGITETCDIEDSMEHKGKGYYGLAWRLPFVPFSLLWAVYKLIFLPFHPVDRIVNMVEGYPQPMSEPVFKLLTEPFSQTTFLAQCINMCAKVGKTIRYSLLPNSIMLPLFSMGKRKGCADLIYYDMDTGFATVIYGYVIFDLILTFMSYIIGKFLVGGQCIGTCKYKLYKLYWFISLWTSVFLFFADLFFILDYRFWQGLFKWLNLTLLFDPSLSFAIDMVQKLLGFNMLLDYIQLLVLILGLILPRLPCLKFLAGEEGARSYELLPTRSRALAS